MPSPAQLASLKAMSPGEQQALAGSLGIKIPNINNPSNQPNLSETKAAADQTVDVNRDNIQEETTAEDLDIQPRLERDIFTTHVELSENVAPIRIEPDVSLAEIVLAFSAAMKRAEAFEHHTVAREALSTRERMSLILSLLTTTEYTPLERLFTVEEGKAGVVVCFLAILELVKEQLILCIQAGPYAKIHVKLGAHEEN